ncbi:cytochrome P450 [Mycena rosella]|uniref:Cytochrome P450 n=1 Tax=Mycena rosella TaxID=1033263 RepID=A0AAD7GD17_MYCRO|nr:cytochrome P450 [Mycena rosella]
MMLYPDVQRKAQAGLDMVIGRHRLPEFDDRDNLTYLSCIIKELLRWRPVAAIGLSSTTKTRTYKDPESFIPERFMGDEKEHVCPGRFFADDSLFLFLASILHVFHISKPLDGNGDEYEPSVT